MWLQIQCLNEKKKKTYMTAAPFTVITDVRVLTYKLLTKILADDMLIFWGGGGGGGGVGGGGRGSET